MTKAVRVLIPAAGSSSRLGTNKQLVACGGEALLRRAVQRALAAGCPDVTVVTGFAADVTGSAVAGLGCRLVHNPYWEQGLGSSIAAGVSALADDGSALLVLLPDQFEVSAAHLARLVKQHDLAPQNLVASRYGEVLGVPAVFPARFFAELKGLAGQPGARDLFQSHRFETLVLDCPEAALDLDTPADLERLRSREESRVRPGEAPHR